jgi:NAD(P)-dependent dehydrogenase (short-subunit alcohol dehydrogenase family)
MTTSMEGKIALITGATSGMGKATAAGLAKLGATVVLVARSQEKGLAVRDEIRALSGNPRVEVLFADLSSQQGTRALAAEFQRRYAQLHVLVNNAGGIFFRRETTVDGLELTFALDHLAYFLLTSLLLDTLKASAPARIINISSNAEASGRIDFDDLQAERRYVAFPAYAQAKLANMLFTYELARRLEGAGVTVNAVRPGPVATNFGGSGRSLLNHVFPLIFRVIGKPPEEAAKTALRLASDPSLAGVSGKAFYNEREVATSARAQDIATQQRLWQVSAELTGLMPARQAARTAAALGSTQ